MPPALQSRYASSRWGIVVLLMAWTGLGHFCRVGIAVAGDEVFISKIGISAPDMGWIYTGFLIVYTTAMIPGGWLIDRIGAGRALTLLGVTMGTLVVSTGVSGWVTSTPASLWLTLMIVRGIAGMCSAPLHPSAAHLVSDVVSRSGRATANGMVTCGALFGVALTQPLFGAMITGFTWEWAFVLAGGTMILYALFWRVAIVPGLPSGGHVEISTGEFVADPVEDDEPKATSGDVWRIFKRREIWLVTFSYALYSYFQYLFFYWKGYYFKDVLHVPVVEARNASFYIDVAMGVGMAIGGLGTDFMCRLLGTAGGRRCIVMTGTGLASLFALMAVRYTTIHEVTLFFALSMACLGMCEGVFWTSATDVGGKARGFAGAFMNAGGNVGGFISPVLSPYLANRFGWSGAIQVACGLAALGGVIWLAIRPAPPSVPREGLLALEEDDGVQA